MGVDDPIVRALTTEERIARMERAWEKHLRGETVTLDEFLDRRVTQARPLTAAKGDGKDGDVERR